MATTYPAVSWAVWQGGVVRKLTLVLAVALCGSLLGACSSTVAASSSGATTTCEYQTTADAAKKVDLPPPSAQTGVTSAKLKLDDQEIALTFDQNAPCTVNSFVSLAKQGYFDNTACHRLVNGSGLYVLQCGDPSGTGGGGPGYQFADELSGSETYPAGTIAMANAGPGTNGSQFFIVYGDSQLPPSYTVFGHTDAAGIKAVEDLAAAGHDQSSGPSDGHPVAPAEIKSVTIG